MILSSTCKAIIKAEVREIKIKILLLKNRILLLNGVSMFSFWQRNPYKISVLGITKGG